MHKKYIKIAVLTSSYTVKLVNGTNLCLTGASLSEKTL